MAEKDEQKPAGGSEKPAAPQPFGTEAVWEIPDAKPKSAAEPKKEDLDHDSTHARVVRAMSSTEDVDITQERGFEDLDVPAMTPVPVKAPQPAAEKRADAEPVTIPASATSPAAPLADDGPIDISAEQTIVLGARPPQPAMDEPIDISAENTIIVAAREAPAPAAILDDLPRKDVSNDETVFMDSPPPPDVPAPAPAAPPVAAVAPTTPTAVPVTPAAPAATIAGPIRKSLPDPGPEFFQKIEAHIKKHIGPVADVFKETASDLVRVDVYHVGPTDRRPYHTLITAGMSAHAMRAPGGAPHYSHAELICCLPKTWPVSRESFTLRINSWPVEAMRAIARLPHEERTWLWWGHTLPNGQPPESYDRSTRMCCAFFLSPMLVPGEFCELEVEKGKTIHFFGFVPIYREEMNYKMRHGAEKLVSRFERFGVSELLDIDRSNTNRGLLGIF
ncbi:suppressor of fused domain protein [Candidatus Poribacteria bacterium]|nr:suppressor of fused domain protein [Candidatus Poribacteria bacterium]